MSSQGWELSGGSQMTQDNLAPCQPQCAVAKGSLGRRWAGQKLGRARWRAGHHAGSGHSPQPRPAAGSWQEAPLGAGPGMGGYTS